MRLSSPAFSLNQPIPSQFTCDGQDVNPALRFDEVPREAKSLALIVDDPDAPSHSWVHWTLWNIDPALRDLPEGSVPEGAMQGLNDFGDVRWGGPCPPSGKAHHYRFTAYALSARLGLPSGSRKPELMSAMRERILAQAEWIGTYRRIR